MPTPENTYPTQHIGGTILVVMMEVDPAHEDEFNRWFDILPGVNAEDSGINNQRWPEPV
jgi:hypothetical protein